MSEALIVCFFSRDGTREETRMALRPPSGLGENAVLKPRGAMETVKRVISFRSIDRNCGGNVKMNKDSFEKVCGKRMHTVCGSFGIRDPKTKDVWWEWGTGDIDSSAKDLLFCKFTGMKNCHFWLEDDDGNVYDIIQPYITNTVAPIHHIPLCLDSYVCRCIIMGKSKEELEQRGILYLPARPKVQKRVIRHTEERLMPKVVD
jgi:hypothetical protein